MNRVKLFIGLLVFVVVFTSLNDIGATTYADNNKNLKYVICIDPGHQLKGNNQLEPLGPGSKIKKPKVTSGTCGVVTKKPEYVFTLEFSKVLKKKLEEKGYKVVMTREKNDVNISNSQRAKIANKAGAALFIRIHADGSNNRSIRGLSILVPSTKNKFCGKLAKQSQAAAKNILDVIKPMKQIKSERISYRDDMTGFNWCKVPSILIEAGFMSNPQEDKMLSDSEYQNNLSDAIVKGVEKFVTR